MRALILVLASLSAFLLGAAALEPVLEADPARRDPWGVLAAKVHRLETAGGAYNLLFLGSSRMYRHIVPPVFDAEVAQRGLAVKSFNLGVPGMQVVETLRILDWILGRHPPGVRWVVIELQKPDNSIKPENRMTGRVIDWHTVRATSLAVRLAKDDEDEPGARRAEILDHLEHGACRFFHLGAGLPWATDLLGLGQAPPGGAMLPDEDGYLPLEMETRTAFLGRRQELLDDPGFVKRRYRRALARDDHEAPDEDLQQVLWEAVERTREAGVQPLFLVHPIPARLGFILGAGRRGPLPGVFAYNRPAELGEYYRPANRFDRAHLNRQMSEDLTRRFARDFADWVLEKERR